MSRRDAHGGVAQRATAQGAIGVLAFVLCFLPLASPEVRAGGVVMAQQPGAESGTPPPGAERRPEQDADASEPSHQPGSRGRPRDYDDSDRAPRADEGCPYRGRKLDLIV